MINKKSILSLLLCLVTFIISAQTYEWSTVIPGNGSNGDYTKTDNNGNVYTVGNYGDVADFNPGTGTYTLAYNGSTQNSSDVFIQKLDKNGNFKWAVGFGGIDQESANGMTIDGSGNVYVIGNFWDTVDFNAGVGTNSITSSGSKDIYIQKYDSLGNYLWTKTIGGADSDDGGSICFDGQGHIYIIASISGTVDVDPGIGVTNFVSSNNSYDILFEKLDLNGDLVWAKQIGGSGSDFGEQVLVDSQGNIVLSGGFNGTVDFDPAVGTTNLVSNGSFDIFVSKFNSSGNLNWAKSIGGVNYDNAHYLAIDYADNIFMYDDFDAVIDFDPSTNVFNLTPSGNDFYLCKWNYLGDFVWAKKIGSLSGSEYTSSLSVDQLGFVYFTGYFNSTIDFDAGTGIANITPNSFYDGFICKYDNFGNYIWANKLSGQGGDQINNVYVDSVGSIYFTGYILGITDFNPSAATNTLNVSGCCNESFTAKWSQDKCAYFSVSVDTLSDINCSNLTGYAACHANYGTTPYSYTWGTTPVVNSPSVSLTSGGFIPVTVSDAGGCSQTRTLVVSDIMYPTDNDLSGFIVTNNFRVGFNTNIWALAYNNGCIGSVGNVKLVLDTANLVFNFSNPAPDLINADTLIWNFNSINYDSLALLYYVSVTTKTTSTFTDSVKLKLVVGSTTNDIDITNNERNYLMPILNGYDPNDIKVYPEGKCTSGYIVKDQLLTYTIRFQNTGNSNAINIYVIDSLDVDLDNNSLRIISSSHDVVPFLLSGNRIKFSFDDINLPAMSQNEAQSHGFVVYEIKPKASVVMGETIQNSASIYFDFNEPVITNRVKNTIVSIVPNSCTSVTSLNEIVSNNFKIYPNPTYGTLMLETDDLAPFLSIEISNLIGEVVSKKSFSNISKTSFNIEGSSGIYFLKISDGNNGYNIFKIVKE